MTPALLAPLALFRAVTRGACTLSTLSTLRSGSEDGGITAEPPNTAERAAIGGHSAVKATEPGRTAEPPNEPYRGSVVRSSVVAGSPEVDDGLPF